MSITCTGIPSMLRVMYTAYEDVVSKREVVCYIVPTEDGQIDLLYSHHTDYNRPDEKGPWEPPYDFSMALTPALRSEISVNIMHEFWSAFGFRVKSLERKSGVLMPNAKFEGGVTFGR